MNLKLLAFAQARDQLGFDEREFECQPQDTPRQIVQRIAPEAALQMMRVAVDQEYRGWDEPLGEAKEVAIIPPVSGG
jgi:molybdopterin synthase sulfur carrier subunit